MIGCSVLPSPSLSDGEFAITKTLGVRILLKNLLVIHRYKGCWGSPASRIANHLKGALLISALCNMGHVCIMFPCVGILVCHARKKSPQCWTEHEARLFSRSGGFGGDSLPCWNDCHCQYAQWLFVAMNEGAKGL